MRCRRFSSRRRCASPTRSSSWPRSGFLGLGVQPPSPGLGPADQRGAQLLRHRAVDPALPGGRHRAARDRHQPDVRRPAAGHAAGRRERTERRAVHSHRVDDGRAARVVLEIEGPAHRVRDGSSACCRPCGTSRSSSTSTRASASSASPARASRRWPWGPSATWRRTARHDGSVRLNGVELLGLLAAKELRALWGAQHRRRLPEPARAR